MKPPFDYTALGLEWRALPTEAGWYWHNWGMRHEHFEVFLMTDARIKAEEEENGLLGVRLTEHYWLGPLPEPMGPGEAK